MDNERINFTEDISRNISYYKIQKPKHGEFADFPVQIDKKIVQLFQDRGIGKLYCHQAQALGQIFNNQQTVITTGVSSGKSLIYQIAVLQEWFNHPKSRSLFIFPTKALAQDQKQKMVELIASIETKSKPSIGVYDGDTPKNKRKIIRKKANFLFTNPDMLHLGILPHHTRWAKFFRNLKYIIIDEIHVYRGIFGSHFSNLMRRLQRIANFYGTRLQFIMTSATVANVKSFANKLIEKDVTVIDKDYSIQGKKHLIIYNPPIINHELGIRRSAKDETLRLAAFFYNANYQSLIFARSRRLVELILNYLHKTIKDGEKRISGYRGGYLPAARRKIESDFRKKIIKTIVATNALELGIDIGSLDAVLVNGYPGSIASTRQEFGRAGRKGREAVAILIASSNLLDQYIVNNPEYLLKSSPEEALINPDNSFILLHQLKCALFEKPFSEDESFGNLDKKELTQYLGLLQKYGIAQKSGDKYYWKSAKYAAENISLRTVSGSNYVIKEKDKSIGIVDNQSVFWFTHPRAVYLQEGVSYFVKNLDSENKIVSVEKADLDYYTQAQSETEFQLLEEIKKEEVIKAAKYFGKIKVIERVIGFKKIKWTTNEVLGYEDLELPAQKMITTGFWIILSDKVQLELDKKDINLRPRNKYGKKWKQLRKEILKRDEYKCQNCGFQGEKKKLHIHHKKPLQRFKDLKQANRRDNLITLCPSCHKQAEKKLYIQSAMAGLTYLFGHIAPFFVMCAKSDIRVNGDSMNTISRTSPALIIYDAIPGGIGLSEKLFDKYYSLIWQGLSIVNKCQCEEGCPACVGPKAEYGSGAKKQVQEVLKLLVKE